MISKSKLFVAGVLGVSMIFTGCNTSNKADAKSVLKSASEKMNTAKSYEMDMSMTMDASVAEQGTLSMKMITDAKCMANPEFAFQMDSTIDMDMDGESQSIEMQQYVVKEDSQYVMYTGTMGFWGKTPLAGLEEAEAMMQNPTADIDAYLAGIEDISFSGEKSINGIDCQEIKVNLTKEYFDETLSDLNVLDTLGVDAASLDSTLSAMEGMEDLPIYYYVGKESGELVGCSMDMSELLKKVIEATAGETENQFEDFKVVMELTFDNINGVAEVVLPEEAKTAQEVALTK